MLGQYMEDQAATKNAEPDECGGERNIRGRPGSRAHTDETQVDHGWNEALGRQSVIVDQKRDKDDPEYKVETCGAKQVSVRGKWT